MTDSLPNSCDLSLEEQCIKLYDIKQQHQSSSGDTGFANETNDTLFHSSPARPHVIDSSPAGTRKQQRPSTPASKGSQSGRKQDSKQNPTPRRGSLTAVVMTPSQPRSNTTAATPTRPQPVAIAIKPKSPVVMSSPPAPVQRKSLPQPRPVVVMQPHTPSKPMTQQTPVVVQRQQTPPSAARTPQKSVIVVQSQASTPKPAATKAETTAEPAVVNEPMDADFDAFLDTVLS